MERKSSGVTLEWGECLSPSLFSMSTGSLKIIFYQFGNSIELFLILEKKSPEALD